MTSFDVIVVAYNRQIDKIAGFQSFLKSDLVKRVVICDNSTDESILKVNAKVGCGFSQKVEYVPMCGNQGLAKAYNRGLAHCESEFVVIFDDDTAVPEDYFVKVAGYCERDTADIYLPIVRSRNIIMSPCLKQGLSFKAITSVDELDNAYEISAINSGMVVRHNFYDICRYDERLLVDGIDHRFMDEARAARALIVVMPDVELTQEYSQEIHDRAKQVARLKIRAKDSRVYYGDSWRGRMRCALMIQYWKLKLARKYKDFKLIWLKV